MARRRSPRGVLLFLASVGSALALWPLGAWAEDNLSPEAARLRLELDANAVAPQVLQAGFSNFTAAAKNELVAWEAHQKKPISSGRIVARLPFILTPENKRDMQEVFLRGLRAATAEVRTSSLYGLQRLDYPKLERCAERLLQDDSDDVLVAVFTILIPRAKQDARLWRRLHSIYTKHRDDPSFYTSNALLQAQGLDRPERPPKS